MTIRIWGVTASDNVYSRLYENVTEYGIYLQIDRDNYFDICDDITLKIKQGEKETEEDLSIYSTFNYNDKTDTLMIEFHDY